MGRLIRGVKNGPSPEWLQDRLRAIGLRPISALVDITNFFTYDRGRPLHVFDADKVHGAITVRVARPGESLKALDEKTYTFDGSETLVCDDHGSEGIGGVMGGLRSGVTEETINVFLEAAYCDPIRTARTGRRAQDQLRRPLPLRARHRSGLHPTGHRAGHPHDPRSVRRRRPRRSSPPARSPTPRAATASTPPGSPASSAWTSPRRADAASSRPSASARRRPGRPDRGRRALLAP